MGGRSRLHFQCISIQHGRDSLRGTGFTLQINLHFSPAHSAESQSPCLPRQGGVGYFLSLGTWNRVLLLLQKVVEEGSRSCEARE